MRIGFPPWGRWPLSVRRRNASVVPMMKPQDGPSHLLRSHRLLLLGTSLFVAVTIAAAWLAVWNLRGEQIAAVMKDRKNLAVVLAEQTSRAVQAVDLVVQDTQRMVLAAGVTDPDQFR